MKIKSKNKIIFVSPKRIKYCIFPSKYCDYTHAGLSKFRPHAGVNRGVFAENHLGFTVINVTEWDRQHGVLFSKIHEYEALMNHFTGKENWKKSKFAKRCVKFIELKNTLRGYSDPKKFLIKREKQIDELFDVILLRFKFANSLSRS